MTWLSGLVTRILLLISEFSNLKEGKTQVRLTTGWLLSRLFNAATEQGRFDTSMYQVSLMISAEITCSLVISVQER